MQAYMFIGQPDQLGVYRQQAKLHHFNSQGKLKPYSVRKTLIGMLQEGNCLRQEGNCLRQEGNCLRQEGIGLCQGGISMHQEGILSVGEAFVCFRKT